jgi:hypothetical protein
MNKSIVFHPLAWRNSQSIVLGWDDGRRQKTMCTLLEENFEVPYVGIR